jgi:Protein of unknown function (DUF3828)
VKLRDLVAAIAVTLSACFVSGQVQNRNSAKVFVQQVYRDYANPDIRHQVERQKKFYTTALNHLIVVDRSGRPGDVGNLDADPICDCQDAGDPGDLKVQSINLTDAGQGRLKAAVLFTIVKEPRSVNLLLVPTTAGWRIDDISAKGMPSLRALLQAK